VGGARRHGEGERRGPGSTPVSRMRGWPNTGSRPGQDSS
jgi:hypothetical protein